MFLVTRCEQKFVNIAFFYREMRQERGFGRGKAEFHRLTDTHHRAPLLRSTDFMERSLAGMGGEATVRVPQRDAPAPSHRDLVAPELLVMGTQANTGMTSKRSWESPGTKGVMDQDISDNSGSLRSSLRSCLLLILLSQCLGHERHLS